MTHLAPDQYRALRAAAARAPDYSIVADIVWYDGGDSPAAAAGVYVIRGTTVVAAFFDMTDALLYANRAAQSQPQSQPQP